MSERYAVILDQIVQAFFLWSHMNLQTNSTTIDQLECGHFLKYFYGFMVLSANPLFIKTQIASLIEAHYIK